MIIDYIILNKDFYYKNGCLIKRVYNLDVKEFVYITILDNINLTEAIEEINNKNLQITIDMIKNYKLSID